MRDDEFQKTMETWADAEVDSAPDLRPTPEMVRLVQARGKPRRAFAVPSTWAIAAAAAAGLVLVVALFALILRSSLVPGMQPTVTLIAQRKGAIVESTAIVRGGEPGPAEKGKGRGTPAFSQLRFEYRLHDAETPHALDLLNPPREAPSLTPAGDYRLVLEPTAERHVYVYQLTSSGHLVRLFPSDAYSEVRNPLQPGQAIGVPSSPNWLYLDGVPGKERLYIVAAAQSLADLEDLYAQYTQESDTVMRRENLLDLLDTLDAIMDAPANGASGLHFAFQHR